jgi:hypothetical protein
MKRIGRWGRGVRTVRYPARTIIGDALSSGATHTHRNTPTGGTQRLAMSPEHHAL